MLCPWMRKLGSFLPLSFYFSFWRLETNNQSSFTKAQTESFKTEYGLSEIKHTNFSFVSIYFLRLILKFLLAFQTNSEQITRLFEVLWRGSVCLQWCLWRGHQLARGLFQMAPTQKSFQPFQSTCCPDAATC
jgi:hypothetical protein